jgi:hypothetical protein
MTILNLPKLPKMKKTILSLYFFSIVFVSFSQEIIPGINKVTIDTTGTGLPIVIRTNSVNTSAKPNNTKSVSLWFEAGNGYFSTEPVKELPITGNKEHSAFLLSTKLYDTSKENLSVPSYFRFSTTATGTGAGSNSFSRYLNGRGIKIIPNSYDIVPGDTMAFAVSYKTYNETPLSKDIYQGTHKIYFFYNNNFSFDSLTANSTFGPTGIPFCRTHNQEDPLFLSPPSAINRDINNETYLNAVCFNIPNINTDLEKTVFVTLVPPRDLELGKSGSVFAVLTDSTGTKKFAEYLIPNMPFAPAHDPNYIVQRPVCLLLEKKIYPFTYTVHFQNTGGGNAKEVKLVINLPKGMNWGSLKIVSANYAGQNYIFPSKPLIDQKTNQITLLFKGTLNGTNVSNPSVNPLTMGEVNFTINSTPDTDNKLEAFANIFFLSETPNDRPPGKYEDPVQTNIAVTRYKSDCSGCTSCPDPTCHKILWLCWWWWLIILFAILLVWFIIARRRKNKNKQAPSTS